MKPPTTLALKKAVHYLSTAGLFIIAAYYIDNPFELLVVLCLFIISYSIAEVPDKHNE